MRTTRNVAALAALCFVAASPARAQDAEIPPPVPVEDEVGSLLQEGDIPPPRSGAPHSEDEVGSLAGSCGWWVLEPTSLQDVEIPPARRCGQDGDVLPPRRVVGFSAPQDDVVPPPRRAESRDAGRIHVVGATNPAECSALYMHDEVGRPTYAFIASTSQGAQAETPEDKSNIDYVESDWWSGEVHRVFRTYRRPNESSSNLFWRHGNVEDAAENQWPPNPDPSKPLSQQGSGSSGGGSAMLWHQGRIARAA